MSNFKATVRIREELCIERKAGPCGLIIFGASGDLTHRKLLPALFSLYRRDLLPKQFYFMGFARTNMSEESFRDAARESLHSVFPTAGTGKIKSFLAKCHYMTGDYDSDSDYAALSSRVAQLDGKHANENSHIFYLSTPPQIASRIVHGLCGAGLTSCRKRKAPEARVVIEKPFGHDLESAVKLSDDLHECLDENQIYRIDHYLGKETVQNIMMLRFANLIFEQIWNRDFIDHVQITVAEDLGIGHRAGYYEKSGLLRDMFQNHMMQILALIAMEPPASFEADRVRDEKVKLLRAVRPFDEKHLDRQIVRGRYTAGKIREEQVPGYLDEEGVAPDSSTETFVAARVQIDNWRWQGVPFYLRSGKRLPKKVSEVAIRFRKLPHSIFEPIRGEDIPANELVLNIQPNEGIGLTMAAKHPGPRLCMASLTMDFAYNEVFNEEPPDAYERLLLDAMLGDQTLFIRQDTMEVAWSIFTPVLKAWHEAGESVLCEYEAGTWGPKEARELIERDGRRWREP